MSFVACPRDCYDTCFFRPIKSKDGFILEPVPEPFGVLAVCPRGAREASRTYSSDRVLYPFVKSESGFRRVDWGRALDFVVDKIRDVLSSYDPESILFVEYAGNMALITRYYSRRLWYYIGSSFTDGSICDASGDLAISLHYGSSYGVSFEEMYESDLFVYWGYNPALTNIHNFKIALDMRKMRGTPIVVVDVYRTRTASVADLWIKPRPGTDIYLALGVANYLIENDLINYDFIEEYTKGFREFKKHVSKFTLDYVSDKTGVSKRDIIELGELYWSKKPSITFIGYGLQRRKGGGEAVRAISLIPALLGLPRGFYYSNTEGLGIDFNKISGRYLGEPSLIIPQPKLGEFLLSGKFRFVYIHLTNPAFSYPGAKKIREGLSRDDVFVVVHETHWSETAQIADVVLPAPTWPEKDDFVRSYWHRYMVYNRRIIEPLGESRPEYWVMWELAKKLGFDEPKLFEDPFKSVKEALGDEVYRELMEKGYVKLPYKSLTEYQTPSGKIEFYSDLAIRKGYDPLPTPKELDSVDGLVLITTTDSRYTNSQFRDVYGKPMATVFMSPQDMEKIGAKDGDFIVLKNENGEAIFIAKSSKDVPQGIILAKKQVTSLNRVYINELTSDEVDDYGGATINSTIVKVYKLDANRV